MHFLSFQRSECHVEEGGKCGCLQASRGDPPERGTVLHQDVHHCAHHRDQLPSRSRVQRGDSGWSEMQGNPACAKQSERADLFMEPLNEYTVFNVFLQMKD